ncbi:MAG: hypothetical protein C5B50_28755 [Verrucomicrobia bacterium]|nr:MAG: hypothetical protein C5B50_28755 [Verrucomicrobiota bacterium]
MNPRKWLKEHSLKVLAIRDTPEAIAGGVTIGLLIGFSPLFGLKTLLAIFVAWVTRCNILAAVLATTVHDIVIPFMFAIYIWQYDIGFWLLSQPHRWPPPMLHKHLMEGFSWHKLVKDFTGFGIRALLGWAVCALPIAPMIYFPIRKLVWRHQVKKQQETAPGA